MSQNNSHNPPQYTKVEQQMSLQEYDQNTNQQQQQSQQQWNNSNYQDNNQQLFAPPPPMFQVSIPSNDNNTPQGSNINSAAPPVFAPPPANYAQPPPQYQHSNVQQQQTYNIIQTPQITVYEYNRHEYQPQKEYNNVVEQNAPLLVPVPDEELLVGQMSGQGKKKFLIQVTALWDFQLIIQNILDKWIFSINYFIQHKILFIFLTTTIILFLAIRFVKVFRTNNKYAIPMFFVFTMSYAMFAAGLVSCMQLLIIGELPYEFLLVQLLSLISLTVLIITFFIWKDEPKFRNYSPRLLIGPALVAIYFMIFLQVYHYSLLLLHNVITYFWLLYYLNTVFKILNGKFNLRKNDYVIGCMLTYCQMIFPEC